MRVHIKISLLIFDLSILQNVRKKNRKRLHLKQVLLSLANKNSIIARMSLFHRSWDLIFSCVWCPGPQWICNRWNKFINISRILLNSHFALSLFRFICQTLKDQIKCSVSAWYCSVSPDVQNNEEKSWEDFSGPTQHQPERWMCLDGDGMCFGFRGHQTSDQSVWSCLPGMEWKNPTSCMEIIEEETRR